MPTLLAARLRAPVALSVAFVLTASLLSATSAHAESQSGVKPTDDGYDGVGLTSADVDNGRTGIRVVAHTKGITESSGPFSVDVAIETSPIGSCPAPDSCSQRVNYYVTATPSSHTVDLIRIADGPGSDDVDFRSIPCTGLTEQWEPAAEQVTVFVPHSCLGRDAGQAKVVVDIGYQDSHYGNASTRRLVRGERGAAAFDVNGDRKRDSVSHRYLRSGKYRVTVDLGTRSVRAVGTLPRALRDKKPHQRLIKSVDFNRDGRAEVLIPVSSRPEHDAEYNVFTLVGKKLRLVKVGKRPLVLRSWGDQHRVQRNFACTGTRITTWSFVSASSDDKRYTVMSRTYRLDGSKAFPSRARKITEEASTLESGNWSKWGCLL